MSKMRQKPSWFRMGVSAGVVVTTGLWVLAQALGIQGGNWTPAWVRAVGGAAAVGLGIWMWAWGVSAERRGRK